jgi:hypothetical protein
VRTDAQALGVLRSIRMSATASCVAGGKKARENCGW